MSSSPIIPPPRALTRREELRAWIERNCRPAETKPWSGTEETSPESKQVQSKPENEQ